MEKSILHTIKYFSLFSYPPSTEEVYFFLDKKTHYSDLQEKLSILVTAKKIIAFQNPDRLQEYWFTLPDNENFFLTRVARGMHARKKIERVRTFLRRVGKFPQIKMMGFSGSIAMTNTDKNSDIDLFMVTSNNRMWTARFLVLLFATLYGLRGKDNPNMICLNLIFSENDITIPAKKRNEYVAHEILQFKPVINKDSLYQQFIEKNNWVFEYFPQGKALINSYNMKQEESKNNTKLLLGNIVETLLKLFQKKHLDKNSIKVNSDDQLWLIQEDFENTVQAFLRR